MINVFTEKKLQRERERESKLHRPHKDSMWGERSLVKYVSTTSPPVGLEPRFSERESGTLTTRPARL